MFEDWELFLTFLTEWVKQYGIYGVFLIVFFLFMQDPDRILKIKSIFFSFFNWAFKIGKKSFVSSKMTLKLNAFFNDENINHTFRATNFRFKIRWVKKSDDPILKENGTIILNLDNSYDQTRNTLKATQLSLPLIVCPSLRKSINKEYQEAIDLTLMKKMTDNLGQFVFPIFEKYFLKPSIEGNYELSELYSQLIQIDNFGIFTPIFLEELNILSSRFYSEGNTSDITEDIKDFLIFLLSIAEREIGEEIVLNYISKYFRLGILLVAKKIRAELYGTKPYLERVKTHFKNGCDKVYIVGYESNRIFFNRLHRILLQDTRYSTSSLMQHKTRHRSISRNKIDLLSVERNQNYSDQRFRELVDFHKIKEGDFINAKALDVLDDIAIFDIFGLSGFVYQKECSWKKLECCSDVFRKNSSYNLKIIEIDKMNERIVLTNKQSDDDPLLSEEIPKVDDVIEVIIKAECRTYFISHDKNGLEILILKKEISWANSVEYDKYNGIKTKVLIYEIDKEGSNIYGSIRRNLDNPWSNILQIYPRNSVVESSVLHVNDRGVLFLLPNGLTAFISNEKIINSKTKENFTKGNKHMIQIDKIEVRKKRIYANLLY